MTVRYIIHSPYASVNTPDNVSLEKIKRIANNFETKTGYIHHIKKFDGDKHVATYYPNWNGVEGNYSRWDKEVHENVNEMNLFGPIRTPVGISKTIADAHRKAASEAIGNIKYFADVNHKGNVKASYDEWKKHTSFGPDLKAVVKKGIGLHESSGMNFGTREEMKAYLDAFLTAKMIDSGYTEPECISYTEFLKKLRNNID